MSLIKGPLLLTAAFSLSVAFQSGGQINSSPAFENRDSFKVATEWMKLLTDLLRKDAIPPPGCLRIYAYTGLALYESQVPGMPEYQSLFTYFSGSIIPPISKARYYAPIAANTAIAELVKKLAILKSQKEIDSLQSSYNEILRRHTSGERVNASTTFGRQIADSIFEWSKSDGTFTKHTTYLVPQARNYGSQVLILQTLHRALTRDCSALLLRMQFR